jgi:ActR/RegA family two-component response regulator
LRDETEATDKVDAEGRRSVLVVDDDATFLSTVAGWLSTMDWCAICVRSSRQALRAARNPTLSLALVDYRLEDRPEGIRLGRALRRRRGLPFVLISGYLNTDLVVDAVNAGALDVIDKPVTEARLRGLFERAVRGTLRLQRHGLPLWPTCQEPIVAVELKPAAVRWSHMVLGACHAKEDPRTMSLWGKAICTSESTIDETCRLCDVKAIDSRDLARFLRVAHLSRSIQGPLSNHLAVGDERTLERLFDRAGIPRDARTVSLQAFLTHQTFVSTAKSCLKELAHLAANSPLFY